MRLMIVAVRDRALDAYLRPFFVNALGGAIRGFQDEINRADGEMFKHPDDYDLYHLGDWDDETGQFTSQQPKQIAIGKNLKQGD